MKKWMKISLIILFLMFIIPFVYFLYKYSPEEIVNYVGIENSLLFLFFVSLVAGFSAWTSFSLPALLVTAVLGGVDPIVLGLVAGAGLFIGDVIMFYIASVGMTIVPKKSQEKMEHFAKYFKEGKMRKAIPIITYVWVGLTPLPNDILIMFLAVIKYPIKKLYVPILLGDITFPLAVTLLTSVGITLF